MKLDKRKIYYGSLALFGVSLTVSNAVEAAEGMDIFSGVMIVAGVSLAGLASKSLLNGDYKDLKVEARWAYFLAVGASLMMLGSLIQAASLL